MAASMISPRTIVVSPIRLSAGVISQSSKTTVGAVARPHCHSSRAFGNWTRPSTFKNCGKFVARNAQIRSRKHSGVVRARGDRGDSNRDDEGVIKDMEVYLDDLSLEYDSVWDTKPAWCQPWTIVTTGLGVVGGSWLTFQNIFVTGGACFLISVWWFSFLYAYPLAYSEMIAERRKMIKDGNEDTFGRRRAQ
ncbi:hypothetical protein MPTK1_3g16400 [Marchantia polymorpha subsp. ruderalis]|uniref:DUF6737 domain-containing protein n=2 Tax=Marchantia polymorpha TaxID=3197 RepID=A0A176VQQ5_MARPO|nr:hypothetical protein AXG93_3271s1290 [Marchantia polymorpha subsp. ruderalis]PTQ48732.1 hypothetical protein MARPO_0004s0031 [Marchantia polymorpha]BBN05845.1 hypothetical protein Mp_3g16400 [Marchantia polymorpha subsp. ruderalis]|eukprot:PTQ48732.1 hypothetical protein MARPO_0004s0031 [Marchantia polymorpha]